MRKKHIWSCKIGETDSVLPPGSDWPMRKAVQLAYQQLTGRDADFVFSGWGAELSEPERAVVENRLPVTDLGKTGPKAGQDQYDEIAEWLLPCNLACKDHYGEPDVHAPDCIASRRPAIAAELRKQSAD